MKIDHETIATIGTILVVESSAFLAIVGSLYVAKIVANLQIEDVMASLYAG
jgi:hypothetical protein